MVNCAQPVSLKHYLRIQRQPELPVLTIPDGHREAGLPQEAPSIPLNKPQRPGDDLA